MDFKNQYKNPCPGFGDADHKRYLRSIKQDKSRREIRSRAFNRNRDLQDVSAPTSPQPVENIAAVNDERKKKLLKWKEERQRKKKMEAMNKKPAFKVGVVHHSLYSPRIRTNKTSNIKTSNQQTKRQNVSNNLCVSKGITKATEKRLEAKAKAAAGVSNAKQVPTTSKNTSLASEQHSKNQVKKKLKSAKIPKSFAPDDHKFKPPCGLRELPLFGLVPIIPTPQEKGDFFIQEKSKTNKLIDIDEQTNAEIDIDKEPNSTFEIDKEHNVTFEIDKEHNATFEIDKEHNATFEMGQQEKFDLKTPDGSSFTKLRTSSPKEDLIVFSPYLTLSRGKKNARKEHQQRLGMNRMSSNEIPTKDTVMQNLNISVEEEERTAQYFKFLLNKETDRLKELCKNWSKIRLEKDVPDDAAYEINQAVGQTNLLISKKFERFRGLVQDCETGRGEMLVTCRDLQGFWDMTYMEVENCDLRFKKLEERRNKDWQEEEHTVIKPIAKKRVLPKKQVVSSSKPSSLRTMILAARKKKIEAGTLNEENLVLQNKNMNEKDTPLSNNRRSITFKEVVNIRRSTRKSKSPNIKEQDKSTPVRPESSRASLTKAQFSNTSKRTKSPYTVMKISQMCKTPEVQLDDTISYVNSDQTPGKSILKKSEESTNKETRTKSTHKVNFDDQVSSIDVPLDEEVQVKLSLSAALSRIDSLDLDEVTAQECINAGKKLKFEDSSEDNEDFLEEKIGAHAVKAKTKKKRRSESPVQNTTDFNADQVDISPECVQEILDEILMVHSLDNELEDKNIPNTPPTISMSATLPSNPLSSETTSNTDMEQDNAEVRVLRNRTITTNDTPKTIRRSKMMTPKSVNKKENKSPIKSHKRKSSKLSPKDENKYMVENKDNVKETQDNILMENVDRKRKSSRKSVAFSNETCLICSETKPALPMTPHVKKLTPSRQRRNKHISDEDSMLWSTPEHLPNRVTRSHTKN